MTTENTLRTRSEDKCELCRDSESLQLFEVPPDSDGSADQCVLICGTCRGQIEGSSVVDAEHWRGLSETMWTPVPAVQVMAWRMLRRLSSESWANDLLEMLYLDDETQAWAEAVQEAAPEGDGDGVALIHRDGNGTVLTNGDAVTLIKDLKVKGAGFTAKRGTVVRNITLVRDNAGHIEGRVSGQQIVILTEFVKKSAS
jgi:protein PhnA